MGLCLRWSPIIFQGLPTKKESRGGWEVVLEYTHEGNGPFLVDLSHVSKWDVQDSNLPQIRPRDTIIPESPGDCTLQKGILINRMNQRQAAIWHLLGGVAESPQEAAYTDATDAYALMAILGKEVFSLMEKVTPLDLSPPAKRPPFLIQGPVLRVPCQVVVLGHKASSSAVLVACSRAYGQSMAEAFLDAGMEWGLSPAGERVFSNWLDE